METSDTTGDSGESGSPTRVLRHVNFRRLWVGSVASAAGASIGSIVIVWLVYNATHSPIAITLLGVFQFLPTLLFGLLAGALSTGGTVDGSCWPAMWPGLPASAP